MRYSLLLLLGFLMIASCKSEKKETDPETEEQSTEEAVIAEDNRTAFFKRLIDVREVNRDFIEGYSVSDFGMLQMNDSLYAYVFKLGPEVVQETVNSYSVGVKGFESSDDKPFSLSFSPELSVKDGENYIIMPSAKLTERKYFDSLDVYIYARNNWKESGRLGGFKVIDVLFIED